MLALNYTSSAQVTMLSEAELTIWVSGPTPPAQLLHLYKTNQEEWLDQLDAASSFIVQDSKQKSLLAVRDFMGVYPLFYAEYESILLASFSIGDLLKSGLIPIGIHPTAVCAYVNWQQKDELISDQTFYQHIYRLLPGHMLRWKADQLTIQPYQSFTTTAYANLTDQTYLNGFKTRLVAAVQRAVPPDSRTASHLSGGLDSSSVCSIAQSVSTQPVHSFFIKTDTPTTQEEHYAEALLAKWKQAGHPFQHQFIRPALTVYEATQQATQLTGQPCQLILPASTFFPILEQARQAGCQSMLSGHGGDQVTGYGFEYFDQLFDQQNWSALSDAFRQFAQKRTSTSQQANRSRRQLMVRFIVRKARQQPTFLKRLSVASVLITHFWNTLPGFADLLYRKRRRTPSSAIPVLTNWVRQDWLNQQPIWPKPEKVIDLTQLINQPVSVYQREQIRSVYGKIGILFNEDIAELQAHYSLKTYHPFLTKDLLELSLQTPLALRFGDGLGRGVLRKAMVDYLPDAIARRPDKGEFSAYTHQTFSDLYASFCERVDPTHAVWEIIERATFDEAVRLIADKRYTIVDKNPLRFAATRVIYLSIWLDYLKTITG